MKKLLAVALAALLTMAASPTKDELYTKHQQLQQQLDDVAKQLRDWTSPVVEPPPPPPPPPVTNVEINSQPLNLFALVVPEPFYPSCFDRYTRTPTQPILNGATWRSALFGPNVDALAICSVNQAAGGAPATWGYPTFALEVGGIEVGRGNPTEGRSYVQLNKNTVPDLPTGWYQAKVYAYDASGNKIDLGARNPDYWVVIDRNGTAKDLDHFIVQSGNYDYVREGGPTHFWAKVPKSAVVAQPRPIPPRQIVPFSTALTKDKIWRTNLSPVRIGNNYRPTITKEGITVAYNRQGYFLWDNYERFPMLPRLDGQRNIGTIYMATDIKIGRHHQVYVLDTCGWRRVDLDGHIKTLVGCRHTEPTYYVDAKTGTNVEWVGDWSAVIAAGQPVGTIDSWGIDWIKSTLAVNENAPLIGDEHPHVTGPEALWADPVHGRLLKVKFAPDSREVPPKVTPCATGLSDPWDVVVDANDIAYVSERTGDKISRWNANTCTKIDDFIVNDSVIHSTLDSLRRATSSGTIDQKKAASLLAPEGIAFSSDGKKLYVGSTLQQAIWSFDIATKVRTLRAEPDYSASAKSFFTKIFVCDATFGPGDVVGSTTWSETQFGRPQLFLPPDASGVVKKWDFHGYDTYAFAEGSPNTVSGLYAAAAGCGNGMLAVSTAEEGLAIFSQRLATDTMPADPAKYKAANEAYARKGDRLIWGEYGFGSLNIPPPCNDNEVNYMLKASGVCQ